jgi:hypothetical protein
MTPPPLQYKSMALLPHPTMTLFSNYEVIAVFAMTRWSWLVSLLLWTASVPVTLTLAAAADEEECTVGEDGVCEPLCNDKHRECKPWAAAGECAENPRFMLFECQAACDMCGKTTTQIQEEVVQALEAKEKEQQRLEE